MRRLVLAAPLLALALTSPGACSNSSGSASPPPAPAPRHQPPPDDSAGFAAPPPADESNPAEQAPPVTPELEARIKSTFGEECRYERACGAMIGVDCKAAVDGPYYYVRRESLEIVSTCGGACMRGCTNCPPSDWTCATY